MRKLESYKWQFLGFLVCILGIAGAFIFIALGLVEAFS
jgi:hypothetical protein